LALFAKHCPPIRSFAVKKNKKQKQKEKKKKKKQNKKKHPLPRKTNKQIKKTKHISCISV
jgi:hypothetical protein